MKLLCAFLLFSAALCVRAQNYNHPPRKIGYRIIGKDSINLSLNQNYEMIEDSCAQIIRHGHFDMRLRKFRGYFKDFSKVNPSLMVSEGCYDNDGLKNGLFTSYHLNGEIESRGNFKNDKYDGHWEIFDQKGQPMLIFEADQETIKILEAWNTSGKKYIDAGKGNYLLKYEVITWKGKIENGRPEGTWHAFKTDDATRTAIVDEHFKKGVFISGNSPTGSYTDASRLQLINPDLLPYTHAEAMQMSTVACDGTGGSKHVVNAQYRNGWDAFSERIREVMKTFLAKNKIDRYDNTIVINGLINKTGNLVNLLPTRSANDSFTAALVRQLGIFDSLEPATVDAKPVEQRFTITFTFHEGMYQFSYNLSPVTQGL